VKVERHGANEQMKKLFLLLSCLMAVSGWSAPVVNVKGLAQFGLVSSMSATDLVAIEIATHPRGITLANFTNGLATISYVTQVVAIATSNGVTITELNNTSNALVSVINSTNTVLIATINFSSNALVTVISDTSNFLFGVSKTNVVVTAGTNVVVEATVIGEQTVYKVSIATNAAGGGESIWTNQNNIVHLKTNAPVTLGTNNEPVVTPFYVLSLVSNDSMSGAQIEFVPIAGTATSRAGFDIFMDTGDSLGGFSYPLWGMNTATSSNRFGAYFGNVPFGLIGVASSSGTGDAGGVIGIAEGDTKGTGYGVQGLTDGSNTTNKLVGVFGSGSTNSGGAAGGYFELGDGYATAIDTHPEMSALIADNRKTGFPVFTFRTNNGYTFFQGLGNSHVQLNSNDVYTLVQGTNILFITNGTQLTIHGTASGGGLTGTAADKELSVQAIKLPTTNYPGIAAGWQDWEVVYYKTNAEGSNANLTGSWQFKVPRDYATNTMSLRVTSMLVDTNGPNSSNSIFQVSFVRAASGDSTDLHTAAFGSTVSGTNTWAASGTGTNKIQDLVISLGVQAMGTNDTVLLQLARDAVDDTVAGPVVVTNVRLEYTRP